MDERGRNVSINGKRYKMVYTSAAMLGVMNKHGDVEAMADELDSNPAKAAEIVPWLISLLCNQGIMLDTGNTKPSNPDLLTPELVALYTLPKEWPELLNEAMSAIAIGNGTYHDLTDDSPVDVVLEEIEKSKNADAAGE